MTVFKALDILELIAKVAVCEGRVVVNAPANATDLGLHVLLGQTRLGLKKVARPTQLGLPEYPGSFDLGMIKTSSTSINHGINELPAWSLEGAETLHLQFREREAAEVTIGSPIAIPAGSQALFFQALVANHRARAQIELRIEGPASEPVTSRKMSLDVSRAGGTKPANYQKVLIPIPPSAVDRRASLHVDFSGSTDTTGQLGSYVFMAQVEITSEEADLVYTKPRIISGRNPGADTWYEAELPIVGEDMSSDIALAINGEILPLLKNEMCNATFESDVGQSYTIKAARQANAVVYLNGRAIGRHGINKGRSTFHLPTDALIGEMALVQFRDETGTRVLLQTYTLLPRLITPLDVMQKHAGRHIPAHLFSQSEHRYKSLRAHMADPRSAGLLSRLPFLIETLEAGYANVKLAPLNFPEHKNPEISIVIPCQNKVEITFSCLCALLLAHNKASFEVILVDDGSSDDTARIEDWVKGIKIVRSPKAQQFIRACNAGAAVARGRHIVLLNNDTEPTQGWLDALLEAFTRFPKAGLVGAKLIYPNGRLQDAGSIVWASGNPIQYGSNGNPWDPRFSYARQVDYVSGAALMVPRNIWQEVGGLSSYLEPMYFEDTDLAFKIREAGYATWYIPSSVVYHREGATSGTDTSIGFKRFQEINRPKFKRRWTNMLGQLGKEGSSLEIAKDRGIIGRVLFIDYQTPRADQDAGSYAAIQEIRLVQSLGYKVTFLPENLAHMGAYTDELERMGVEMAYAPFHRSIADFLGKRAQEFDAFYITRYHVAANVLPMLRQLAPQAKVILNNADLHFLRILRSALASGDPQKLAEATRVRDEELAVMRQVDLVLSYNEVERAVIASHSEEPIRMGRCPWVVEIPKNMPPLKSRRGLSFLGSFNHHPNLEGLEWFIREIMARLSGKDKSLTLSIYGSGLTDEIRTKLAADRINTIGYIEDVAEAYDPHRIFIAPLLSGAGIKGKVLAALARGTPTILSPVAAEGIGLRNRKECMIAQTPSEWESAILELNSDDRLWASLSQAGRELVAEEYSFSNGRNLMRAAFETVDMFSPIN